VHGLETVDALGGFASADNQQSGCHGVQCPRMPNLEHSDNELQDIGRPHWHAACHPGSSIRRPRYTWFLAQSLPGTAMFQATI